MVAFRFPARRALRAIFIVGAFALHLFGVPADDRLGGLARSAVADRFSTKLVEMNSIGGGEFMDIPYGGIKVATRCAIENVRFLNENAGGLQMQDLNDLFAFAMVVQH
jgi:hypothetical protein